MRTISAFAIALVATFAFAGPASAIVPDLIPVQGVLTDLGGNPVDGNTNIYLSIYDGEFSSTSLWSESRTGVNQVFVDEGYFTVYLGEVTPLDFEALLETPALWLGIRVGVDPEMDRVRLAAVPFAQEAEHCRWIGGFEADDLQPRVNIGGDTSVGACGAGQVVKAINPTTGAITCVADETTGSSGGEIVSVTGIPPIVTDDDGFGHVQVEVQMGTTAATVAAGNHTHAGTYMPMQTCTVNYVLKYTAGGWVCAADNDTNTTYLAGSGLSLFGTTFSADPTYLQRRVTSGCAVGNSIRMINEDGSVICQADTNTTYTAGAGLSLTGTTFNADTSVLQVRVSATCAAGSSIRSIAADGAVTCETDDSGSGSYTAGNGLTLTGTAFAASYGGTGTATTLARSDHNHNTAYILRSGDTVSTANPYTFNYTGTGYNGWTLNFQGTQTDGTALNISTAATNGTGVYAMAQSGDTGIGTLRGIHGVAVTDGSSRTGEVIAVDGYVDYLSPASTGDIIAVKGYAEAETATNPAQDWYGGYFASQSEGSTSHGVYARGYDSDAGTAYGIYATATSLGGGTAWAGWFAGNVNVTGTVTATTYNYAAAKTGYVTVQAMAFNPYDQGVDYGTWSNGSFRWLDIGATSTNLDASITLPHGVTVTNVSCRVFDNHGTHNITTSGLVDVVANQWACGPFATTGQSGSPYWAGINCTHTVDNSAMIYALRWTISSNQCGDNCRIYGCRVTYTYTSEGR
jgi:hypothetical protein